MLRRLVNAFLALLALDGGVGIADSGMALATGSYALEGVRAGVAFVLGLCVLVLFTAMHFTPRLRLGVFLPPCLLVSWIQLGAMPLPLWFGFDGAEGACGALELAAAFALARHARARTGRFAFDDACLAGENVSSRRVAGFAALILGVLMPATVLYGYLSIGALASHFTAGYLRIDTTGIHARDQTYARGDERIRLIATMHVARPSFYSDVLETIPAASLTLAEGVSDDEGLLSGFDYGGPAHALGLAAQGDAWAEWSRIHAVRAADVDVSELSEPTIRLLQGMARVMGEVGEGDSVGALRAYADLSQLDLDPREVLEDVLDVRNAHLLSCIETALEESDFVVVPWGAAHMKELHARVVEMGFEPRESVERLVLAW